MCGRRMIVGVWLLAMAALAIAVLAPDARAAQSGDVFMSGDGAPASGKCKQRCFRERTIECMRARNCRVICTNVYCPPSGEVPAGGDVFSRDDRAGDPAYVRKCGYDCTRAYGEGAFGNPPCANFKLERCVHQCACDVNPDCGPVPRHREEALSCPDPDGGAAVAGGGTGGAKGLTRKECQEEGAKGIFRKDCEQLVRADCAQFGSKGIFRRECEELRRKDCADAAAKGIHRPGCEKQPAIQQCQPDPVVSVGRLVAAMNSCLADGIRWYSSPKMVVANGSTAFYDQSTTAITYDPAVLERMSLYDRGFFLADAFGAYLMDLEARRIGRVRRPENRAHYAQFMAGFLAHCLVAQDLFPVQIDGAPKECPSALPAHAAFLKSFSRSLQRSGPPQHEDWAEVAHVSWEEGWYNQPGVPLTLRHWPSRQVVERMQTVLALLGHDPGQVDGLWGDRTIGAFHNFLGSRGLSIGSYPSDPAMKALIDAAESTLGTHETVLRGYLED
jgi:hypothetical protein